MKEFPVTDRTRITRLPKRGAYDAATVYAILDEALFCTIAFSRDQQAFQIPTGFCRIDDKLYIHGSVGSQYMRWLAESKATLSVSVTLMDGMVLARSAFNHSVNYRSVNIFGVPEVVKDPAELDRALEVFTEKMCPGRWADIRKPTAGEWKATMVLSIPIEEASAKVRTGSPKDDAEDMDLNVWAGVVPLTTTRQPAIPDPAMKPGIPLPEYLK
jgi:hypothetical protein